MELLYAHVAIKNIIASMARRIIIGAS